MKTCNYAEDGALYASGESLSMIIESLIVGFLRISKQFHKNIMVLNPDKCRFMVLGDPNYTWNLTCNGTKIDCSKKENVLSITTYDKLNFTPHLGNIIKKASRKLHALNSV